MKRIDLNVDIGEGLPYDAELLNFATSANVCCGVHAGSAELTAETVAMCRVKQIRVGAHPGYPDRANFGRQAVDAEHQRAFLGSVLQQIRDFSAEYQCAYVKPHGAFYNDTAKLLTPGWDTMAEHPTATSPYEAEGHGLSLVPGTGVLIMGLRIAKVPLMGLPRTMHEPIARRAGVAFLREGFGDRASFPDGTLKPRGEPGAVLSDPTAVRAQVMRLANEVDSICIHGDTPDCVEFAELIYVALTDAGFEVCA
ncbi:MAG: LamB/YcsF family protein [Fimbriimonadaceae bacterium]